DKDFLASKLAWHFGCTGPCEVVQAACTSSLLCVARGAHALRLGLCDVAICGGVSLTPDEAIAAVDGLIWAPSGVCRPFADDASGTVPADGAAVVLLTNDEELLRRQRPGSVKGPYAVVEGVAVNNDGGRKGGFSQPSEAAQVDLHRLALRDAKCGPGDVDYVEAHGTGT
ncbi:thiolase-like protein, partial [Pelagophyceae sp. CCMP2097]